MDTRTSWRIENVLLGLVFLLILAPTMSAEQKAEASAVVAPTPLARPQDVTPTPTPTPGAAIQAIVGMVQSVGPDGRALVDVRVERTIDPATGSDVVVPGGIGSYEARLSYSAAGIQVKEIIGGAPFNTVTLNVDNQAGQATFSSSQAGASPQAPITLGRVALALVGNSLTSYDLVLTFNSISAVSGAAISPSSSPMKTLRRGDAYGNAQVSITDALFIEQYLVGLRSIGETVVDVNLINAASAKHDYSESFKGEKLNEADTLFIGQAIPRPAAPEEPSTSLRDSNFSPFGLAGTTPQIPDTAGTVSIASATILEGSAAETAVFVNGLSGNNGLGAYYVRIAFDKTKIAVDYVGSSNTGVRGAGDPFGSTPTSNAIPTQNNANSSGVLAFCAFQTQLMRGPTGTIKLATVRWKGMARGVSPLTLSVIELFDTHGNAVAVAPVNGSVNVYSVSSSLTSQPDIQVGLDPSTGNSAVVRPGILRVYDQAGSNQTVSGGLRGYGLTLSYDSTGINILDTPMSGIGTFGAPSYSLQNTSGTTSLNTSTGSEGPQAPAYFANVRLSLVGPSTQSYVLTLSYTYLVDSTATSIPQAGPTQKTFRRGDARADGIIGISDALFIAQYLAGLRGTGETNVDIHPVNAASVKHDTGGDKITISDALLIAQYLGGLKPATFE